MYGLLLVVLMLLRPGGLLGRRELWDLPLFNRKRPVDGKAP